MAELPIIPERELLPEKGLLSFFYDAAREASGDFQREWGSFAVAYFDTDGATLIPRTAPDPLDESDLIIPARISFKVCESEPGWEHPLIKQLLPEMEDIFRYNDIAFKGWFRSEVHGMLGYPIPIQTPVEFDFEENRLGYWEADEKTRVAMNQQIYTGRTDWELLFQVRSDEEIGLYLPPDSAILYFMIRRSDLAAGNFQNAWMIKQSS